VEPARRFFSPLVCFWMIVCTVFCGAGGAGCARIRLNWEMERVAKNYIQLFYDVETAEPETIRRSAEAFAVALDADPIANYSSEEKYQGLLDDSFAATDKLIEAATTTERETLLAFRSRLSASCQACHDEYRR